MKKHSKLFCKDSILRTFIITVFIAICVVIISCATQKETTVTDQSATPIKTPVEKKKGRPVVCEENTSEMFNFSGIRVMPYMKLSFFDMDNDGLSDMIAGGKKGDLHLFHNGGYPSVRLWKVVDGYFEGIKVGAFSAPSAGDLNGDGKPEIAVGSGGFSSKSGQILVFENKGTVTRPEWRKVDGIKVDIGDDAAPAIIDYDFDNKPDIIAGNSEGKLFFFKNISKKGTIQFKRDKSRKINKNLDKYANPAAVKLKNTVVLVVGTSVGKLYRIDMKKKSKTLTAKKMNISAVSRRFLSPSFTKLIDKGRNDLVVADGDGTISYYVNVKGNLKEWEHNYQLFNNRLVAGPACAPTMADINGKDHIVVGNMDGSFKFYEFKNAYSGLPWLERNQFLNQVKVSGFSRGILTKWQDKDLLITGESNGKIQAFINRGSQSSPKWTEKKQFFRGIKSAYHSTPVTFDLDGDGQWELITGSEEGNIHAYRVKSIDRKNPEWKVIPSIFDNIQVRGFSSPAFARYNGSLYLFVGQENGRIRSYKAVSSSHRESSLIDIQSIRFFETDVLNKIQMRKHSSPFVRVQDGNMEIISGDYDGNLRYFVCSEG